MNCTLTEKQQATMLRLADEGMEHDLLAERYGIATHTVSQIVNALRIKRDGATAVRTLRSWTVEQKAEIVRAYHLGDEAIVVARRYGCSRNAILGLWSRAGVLGARRPNRTKERA